MPFSAPAAQSSAPATPARSDVVSMALRNSRRVRSSGSDSRKEGVGRSMENSSQKALRVIASIGKRKPKFASKFASPKFAPIKKRKSRRGGICNPISPSYFPTRGPLIDRSSGRGVLGGYARIFRSFERLHYRKSL